MSITRDAKETIDTRVKRDPEFAKALLDEAASLFLNGEPETARLILRDLVGGNAPSHDACSTPSVSLNATVGFEELANKTFDF